MKKWLSVFVLFFVVTASVASNEMLLKAEKAYDEKQYKTAITLYEKLLKEGYTSYQLYFNLGNAYYKNGNLGLAIHAYEIARKLEPDDEDIKINLSLANSKTVDKIDTKENFFITAVKSNILSSLSTSAWAWLNIISLLIAAAAFFLFYTFSSVAFKRVFFGVSMLFAFIFLISYFLGRSAVKSKSENKFAIILSKEVKIMNEPNVSGTTKFRLHEGTKVRVVENNGDWMLIKLENGNEGWLKSQELGVI
ncbi:MAG: tetratricopeptide repeat protein [Bacteroidia bacterium]|jgi:tetratricopeptide (TPR) repeat protein|nr:tetratricopeptide repeat protein [Bacteroidia bacterium]